MSQKTISSGLFDNFKSPEAPKSKDYKNYQNEPADLYKFNQNYFPVHSDKNLIGFNYVDLLKRGFNIFNEQVEPYYGSYNGNSKFNVEFQKANDTFNNIKESINSELERQQKEQQEQLIQEKLNDSNKQKTQNESELSKKEI